MFGPAFNLFLRKMNFKLFNRFQCDRKSSPGLFMSIIWSFCLLIFIFLYSNRSSGSKNQANSVKEVSGKLLEEKRKSDEGDENEKQKSAKKSNLCKSFHLYKKEFLRVEIVVILLVTFFTYFNQTSLETIVNH
jgi:hypothetical protein